METNWKARLEQWAPEPPEAVWEQLSATLPTGTPLFVQRMRNYQPTPPEGLWDQIKGQLEPSASAPVRRMYGPSKWVRLTAVAASLLFAVLVWQQYAPQPNTEQRSTLPVQQQSILPLPGKESRSPFTAAATARANKPPANTGRVRKVIPAWPIPQLEKEPLPPATAQRPQPSFATLVTTQAPAFTRNPAADRYLLVARDAETAVRLPKKLYEVFRCAEGAPAAPCPPILETARTKGGAPGFLTPTDFAGLLALVQELNTDQ